MSEKNRISPTKPISSPITAKIKSLSEKGKKLSSTDEGLFISAEKLIKEEFAFSLGISPEGVTEYIHAFMEKRAPVQK